MGKLLTVVLNSNLQCCRAQMCQDGLRSCRYDISNRSSVPCGNGWQVRLVWRWWSYWTAGHWLHNKERQMSGQVRQMRQKRNRERRSCMHSRRRQIWTSRKCIRNAIVMLKYRNSYVIAANSFGNSKFVIKFAHTKNLKYKFRICQVYKSEAPVHNKDLRVMQIPNLAMNWQCSQIELHI